MLWAFAVVVIFGCSFTSYSAHLWGGQLLSIPDTDMIHFSEGDVPQSELKVVRSREFNLPSQAISYSEGDKVSKLSF